jgi:hypothetical protein
MVGGRSFGSREQARRHRGLSDEFGIPRLVRPLLGSLLGGLRSRRLTGGSDRDSSVGGPGERIPSDALIASLLQDGMLVLPPRYFIGYFLDLLL